MRQEDFEEAIGEAFGAIPEKFRRLVRNVAFLVESEPSEETRLAEGLADDETLFGLYVGIPQIERDAGYGIGGTLPDTITIYKKPIEAEAGGEPDAIREIVKDTVWHEVAHHFGLEELEIRRKEEARARRGGGPNLEQE